MKHIISILMENEAGALSRVAGLFSARGYNIQALTVAPTEDPTLSRMTITTRGDDRQIEQIIKQLNKLIDVVKVVDLSDNKHYSVEVMLVKLRALGPQREEFKRLADIFDARIVDVTPSTYTLQLVGDSDKLDLLLENVHPDYILETVRSGAVGVQHGDKFLHV
ncbi:acetolactate synthase, small subunit [Sulfurivirga caldicuralii]|uniref:Acetolactate synthase small subunit n=1 Tax=Sulfurivirga caldicuralii TaxID=364032 RepID=A0A1N6G6C3_9GAMM|nr:acetolactate synthase small subunit [Sulfurivirga caldicuralii]SIO03011.1 acetolactate synthase, small subunit [Sulfurivirga caldicuralii]